MQGTGLTYERKSGMQTYYFFMHENMQVAAVEVENSERITRVQLNQNPDIQKHIPLLPYNSNLSKEDLLKEWLNNRGLPVTRQRIDVEFMYMDSKSTFQYMLNNYGLSLTDHYWLKPYQSSDTWETINLYTNDFKSAYSLNLRDDKTTIAGKTNFVPSASLKGDLKKKWIIDQNGIRRLVKGNYNNTCRQSLCEVLATEIHKRQGKFEYTPYSLIEISSDASKIIGCESPNFTSIDTELVSAIEIIDSVKKDNSSNYYETYIAACALHGIDESYIRAFTEYQILTDFIITNIDRHLNNFGIIRDSKTLQFIKPAPIFDSGNSMFYKGTIYTDDGLLNIDVTSFKKKEIQLLEYVTNPLLVDIDLLPTEQEVFDLFMQDTAEKEETNIKLAKAYARKVKYLYELQSGIKIYSYPYLKQHRKS